MSFKIFLSRVRKNWGISKFSVNFQDLIGYLNVNIGQQVLLSDGEVLGRQWRS